jgi:hypothetical protein
MAFKSATMQVASAVVDGDPVDLELFWACALDTKASHKRPTKVPLTEFS